EPLGAACEDRVDDGRDVLLVGRQLDRRPRRELEVGDRLVLHAAPDALLGSDRGRLVVAAADQVEERRRELERADRAALAEKRWDERGLEVVGRLLLVLAVIRALALAAEDRVDDAEDRERRPEREREQDQSGSPRVVRGAADPRAVVLERRGRVLLLGDDLRKRVARLDLRARGRAQQRAREDDPQLDELLRGDR